MTTLREAAQQALEALEYGQHTLKQVSENQWESRGQLAMEALRAALEQPVQEPVCDKDPQGCWNVRCQLGKVCKNTAPPQRQPLTEEEAWELWEGVSSTPKKVSVLVHDFARAIERAHGIGGSDA